MVNWSRYLESLCNAYAQWWEIYTITDVVGQKPVELEPSPLLFDFGLMVQTIERDREEKTKGEDKIERLTVLEGLHKYASEHVLLVGRPGSGKSTALARLLLEEAGKAKTYLNPPLVSGEEDSNSLAPPLIRGAGGVKIPVLVELRYYRTSILDLIQDFLQRHDPNLTVDAEMLKCWLRQGQLLLLMDGLNELPSEEARRDLHKFRQDYQKTTPMIFTTRDLGVGGDLDIAKKLEMQPLTAAQMQQFVRAYLPQQGEQMLRQLGSRLREFGQTPLLLWMLCSLFRTMGKVPPNLGRVFRQFALSYDRKLKQDIPISKEFRRWWHRLLEQLAWVMTSGEAKTQLQVAIPKQKAQAVLTEFLAGKVAHPEDCALCWLEDLLNHHLIQLGAGDQIEFRHQLIQEYYTAESLLKLLPSLSNDELKREYLNYLKWTPTLALMLELVEDEAQAVRVVRLALEVDLRLGARLAGAVKPQWQEQTVGLVAGLEVPQLIKLQLFGLTQSDKSIPVLVRAIADEDSFANRRAADALGKINSEVAIGVLIRASEEETSDVPSNEAVALDDIDTEAGNEGLIRTLEEETSDVPSNEAVALDDIDTEAGNEGLIKAPEDEDSYVCRDKAYTLVDIGSEATIPYLIEALEDEDYHVRVKAVIALGKLGSEAAISYLIKALEDRDYYVRGRAAAILVHIATEMAIPNLITALKNEDYYVRESAAAALGYIGSEAAIPYLIKALEERDYYVRESAATALGYIGSEAAIPYLIKALKERDYHVRRSAATALGNISSEVAIPYLIKALEDEDSDVCWSAVTSLSKIGTEAAIPGFIKSLENEDTSVCSRGENALANIGTEATITQLIKALEDECFVAANKGYTLDCATEALQAIQNRCKFYNPTLAQPIPTPEPQPNTSLIQPISTSLMHILHLSDLHITTPDEANLWSNQLAADLYNDLSIPHLDALIISGDIANYSTQEEYIAAQQFLHNLRQDFPLTHEQIILVPGNHDLNWKQAQKAYKLIDRDDYDGELKDGHYIEVDESVIRVRDEASYKQRFAHLSSFYKNIKQKSYPLDYDQQYTLDHLKEQNLLILGLNSAWQLDHHYKTRASIHMGALTNALTQIRRNPDYKNCLKIAVWHHPLDSAYSDRITDQGFLEQLAVNGFRLFMHGHIHKAETSLFRYDMSTNGRKLDRICAGTFGAPVREWVPGYPLQYNLLKMEDNQLTVFTRRREEPNGAWKPDACWLQGAGKTPLDYYKISLS